MKRTESEWKASVQRLATAHALSSPARARADAERWRRQGYTYDADVLEREIAFWQSAFKVGFAEAIEQDDATEAMDDAA